MRRFVLFELNEVPMRVVQHFAQHHPRSAFARLLKRGAQWDTITPDQGHLSPWITWPTLHRGVSGARHGYTKGRNSTKVEAAHEHIAY